MRVAGAIDIGGTRTKLGLVAEDGRVVRKQKIATTAGGEPEALVAGIVRAFGAMLRTTSQPHDLLPAVGVSVAGFLDRDHARMYANANLPLLCEFPLKRTLEERLERACVLEVDSNAAAIAEFRYGAGRGAPRLLGVTVGTGLGGGVILDGRVLRHTGECAGDLGHILVAPASSRATRRCTCGARGCLEAMVCSAAVSERAGGLSVRDTIRLARTGQRRPQAALSETGRWLGLGLASLSPLFAPDTIVVGGGVAAAGDLLLEPTRSSYEGAAAGDFRGRVTIAGSTFAGWEGVIGAASLVFAPMQ